LNSCCHKSPALLLGLALTAGCSDPGPPPGPAVDLCHLEITPIAAVQGDGYRSPLLDTEVTVRGVVTFVENDGKFYIEDNSTPAQRSSSRALFVSDDELSIVVRPGHRLALSGRVKELGESKDTLTSLGEISRHEICADNVGLPLTRSVLPLQSAERESLEGMRVAFEQELTVTDVYKLHNGELTLSSNGVLRVPTEIREPGAAAVALAKENRGHSIVAELPEPGGPLPVGSTMASATGLIGHDGRGQRFLIESLPPGATPPEAPLAPPAEGLLRVVNSNLLNFFNGDGKGGGFPTERGAESIEEFDAQSARIREAMARIQPDLLAVQELENDGFGPDSSAASLLALLNAATEDDWAVVTPRGPRIGGDVITVGLFYRPRALEPAGEARTLQAPAFQGLSRQPLAQLFRDRRSGESVLVVVNHLKSKGRCPESGENANQQDGQDCWNAARTAAVAALLPWLENLAGEMRTENLLILGDMNAWRMEDPIRRFREQGYVDLVERLSGLPQHSFLYWGQTGTLDYAFASPSMARRADSAVIWHINADFPRKMVQLRPWLRTSDHDPVIVDFDFSQSATSD
jgi:predicted extracellular nuclease